MDKIRVQPSSSEAEKALLGSIIVGGTETFEKAKSWVRNSDVFYSNVNQQLWKSMQSLYRNKENIDTITVLERYKRLNPKPDDGITYYITGLPEGVPTSANVEEYGKILYEKYLRREISKSANKLYSAVMDNHESETEEILNNHTRLIDEIKNLKPTKVNDINNIVDETKELVSSGNNIIKFGMPALDIAAGGMTRKEITVLGGRPGHGKTTLIVNIIRSLVEQNNNCLLYTSPSPRDS